MPFTRWSSSFVRIIEKKQAKILSDKIIEIEYNPEDENGKKGAKLNQIYG